MSYFGFDETDEVFWQLMNLHLDTCNKRWHSFKCVKGVDEMYQALIKGETE